MYKNTHTKLSFSHEDVMLGRAVIHLKRKYEAIARGWASFPKDERKCLERQNLQPQTHSTTGQLVYAFEPDKFIFATLGINSWGHASYNPKGSQLASVDSWFVAGGLRKKKWFNFDRNEFQQLIPVFDAATSSDNSGNGSFTSWLKPFPLLWAGEGKNRIQSYQDTNNDLFTSVTTCEFLPAASLRLYQSVFNNSVWLLRYVGGIDSNWDQRIQRHSGYKEHGFDKAILPFPEVGVPLLLKYGVKVDRGWGAPWRLIKSAEIKESARIRSAGWS